MPCWLIPTIEVTSDIVGLVSSVVLANSAHRLLSVRDALHSSLKKIDQEIADWTAKINDRSTRPEDLPALNEALAGCGKNRAELLAADASTGKYQPLDLKEFKFGVSLLTASFLLKLLFHALTKELV